MSITQLWLLAVTHHRPSLVPPCYAALGDVDPRSIQGTAAFDPSPEDNCRISPAIERIHPGI